MTSPNDTQTRFQALSCTSRSFERERERLGTRLRTSLKMTVREAKIQELRSVCMFL